MNATVLLIEDNPDILNINTSALALRGYTVLQASTLEQGRALFAAHTPDLIVLDIMLPDGSGLELCKKLRAESRVPILFLSALGQSRDVVSGLRSGGDDYLPKPYDLEVLLARIEALLRRSSKTSDEMDIKGLHLDTLSRRAFLNGRDLTLKTKEYGILELLVKNSPRYLAAQDIFQRVWGLKDTQDIRTVKVHISSLRRKLGESAPVRIESRRGNGYRAFIEDQHNEWKVTP